MIAPAFLLLQLAAVSPVRPVLAQDTVPTVTLAEALERAVRLNPDYVQALGSVAEASWARKAARVAFFVPAATASVDVSRYNTPFFNIGTGTLVNTSVVGRLGLSYELFSVRKFTDLGRTQAELESATSTEVQQRFAAALLTESAYYGVLAGQELVQVAREREGRAEQQLTLARARVSSGAAVQSDSLQVRLELVRAQVERLRQESALRVSQLELGRRIGMDGPAAAAPLDTAPPPPLPIGLGDAIARAVEQGPEYRAARARERAADAQFRGRRGTYLPTVTLSWTHSRFDDHFFPSARNVSAFGLNVTLPLWDNGARELQIAQARTNRDVARAIRTDLERAAARDVTEAYDGYQTARATVQLNTEAVIVARENYRVQQARYQAGATIVLDLLDAQNGLSDAESQLVQSRYDALLARARLEAILGTRFETSEGGRP